MRPSLPRIRCARASGTPCGRLGGDVKVDEHGPARRERVDQLRQIGPGRAFRRVGHGRDDQVIPSVVGVFGGQQRTTAPLGDLDVPQRPDPVVPPGHHLEHDGVVPLGEDAEDRHAGSDDRVELSRPGPRVRRQPVEFRAHLLLGLGPLGGDQRGVEAAVTHLPGQVADGRIPHLGGRHQLVDDPPVPVAGVGGGQRLRLAKPPPQQVRHDRDVRGRPAVSQEDPVKRGVQIGRRLQVGAAVVGQGPAQLDPERLGQSLGLDVAGPQVGVHVLLRIAGGLVVDGGLVVGLRLARHPAAPPQRGHVREGLQDLGLACQHLRVVSGQLGTRGGQPLQLPPGLVLVGVIAEHQRTQRRQRVRGGLGRIGVGAVRAG